MEAAGVVFRPLPYLSGGRIDAKSQSSLSRRLSVDSINRGDLLRLLSYRDSRVVRKSSNYGGFCDNAHLQYYSSSSNNNNNNGSSTIMCGSGKKNNKEVVMVIKEKKKVMKKRLKLLKGLSMLQELFIDVGFGLDPPPSPHPHQDHALVDQVKGGKMMILEAADLLLEQLQQLKAEEKELKRKRKEDKAKLKAARMQNRIDYQESSSSSSESSDSECGQEVIDMSTRKSEAPAIAIAIAPPVVNELIQESTLAALPSSVVTTQQGNTTDQLQQVIQEAILTVPSTTTQVGKMTEERGNIECNSSQNLGRECCNPTSTRFTHIGIGGDCGTHNDGGKLVTAQASAEKIHVCMGGKCKKLGAPALLVEFQRALGVEGAVVGCKCMGKCRDGPNVRVLNNSDQAQGVDDSVRTPANPLCIGVGLEDVGLIVANFFGESEKKDIGLAAPP